MVMSKVTLNHPFKILKVTFFAIRAPPRCGLFSAPSNKLYFGIRQEFFLCDSHSRNEEGFITADGASIISFKTHDDVQNYIEKVVSQNVQVLIYQMQYIDIEVTNTDITYHKFS